MSQPFVQHASWIWSAEGTHASPPPEAATPSHYQVRLFRRTFGVSDPASARLEAQVSADSRYVLYCNGRLIGRGPAKGDVNHHFYDSYDLTSELRGGTNVLAAVVLDMSRVAHRPARLGAPGSVMTYAGGFLLEGELRTVEGLGGSKARVEDGAIVDDLSTDARWKVAVDRAQQFQNENTTFEGYQGYFEHRVSRLRPRNWNEAAFDDSAWPAATVLYKAERYEHRRDPASPYGLMPRMIPMMEEGPVTCFRDVFSPGGDAAPEGWRELVQKAVVQIGEPSSRGGRDARAPRENVFVKVPPQSIVEVIFDAGELTTAYSQIEVEGGRGSVMRLTYAEALRLPWATPGARLLGRRQPLANLASHFADENTGWTFDRRGRISGWSDVWEPAGIGVERSGDAGDVGSGMTVVAGGTPAIPGTSAPATEVYEPLHWRAFRYVGLRIATGDEPLSVRSVGYRFTAYPYRISAAFTCSDSKIDRVWHVALRTMRLCAHETFEDCPYYEQMQYAGDTMVTSKIGMLTTGDYLLSRQALRQFDWSRLSDGLTQSRYPSRLVQIIPSWSLHWITNIRDYVYCTGDLETARTLMPGIRAVLDWFRRHTDEEGMPARLPYWNITDWCPWWPRGVVPGADSGPTCIISAQYIFALDEVADLCRLLRSHREIDDLRTTADALRRAMHARFWSEGEGLYLDRPGGPEISQYGNAWAIVCGAAGERERRRMLERFPHDPKLAPGSFFWWHAGFRALERAGVYDRMPEFLGPWHEMIEAGLSTFVEENSYWRSLCHAWSAHPALEFLTRVLGVTPRTPGFASIDIVPRVCGLTWARGSVCTPRGKVSVAWRRNDGRFAIEIAAPNATRVQVRLPNGEEREFGGGEFSAEVGHE